MFPLLTKGDGGGLDGPFQRAKVLSDFKFEISDFPICNLRSAICNYTSSQLLTMSWIAFVCLSSFSISFKGIMLEASQSA